VLFLPCSVLHKAILRRHENMGWAEVLFVVHGLISLSMGGVSLFAPRSLTVYLTPDQAKNCLTCDTAFDLGIIFNA